MRAATFALLTVLLLTLGMSSRARAELVPISNHLKQFHVQQCDSVTCVFASGDIGFMAMSNDRLSAKGVRIAIEPNPHAKSARRVQKLTNARSLDCDQFTFDLRAEFFICDNEGLKQTSYTIGADHIVHDYDSKL